MPLSWINTTCGAWRGEAASQGFFTVGPLHGPSVLVEVDMNFISRGFTTKRFGFSLSTSPEASQANFNQGFNMIRPLLDFSTGSDGQEIIVSSNGSTGWNVPWFTWVPIRNKVEYIIVSVIAQVGSSLMDVFITAKADHLWDEASKASLLR